MPSTTVGPICEDITDAKGRPDYRGTCVAIDFMLETAMVVSEGRDEFRSGGIATIWIRPEACRGVPELSEVLAMN